jgi:hypothetical protein
VKLIDGATSSVRYGFFASIWKRDYLSTVSLFDCIRCLFLTELRTVQSENISSSSNYGHFLSSVPACDFGTELLSFFSVFYKIFRCSNWKSLGVTNCMATTI